MTIVEFLLARLAEDEERARQSTTMDYLVGHAPDCDWPGDMPGWCSCGATARALTECEAKRRIVQQCGPLLDLPDQDHPAVTLGSDILEHLALPHANHPDFREEWR